MGAYDVLLAFDFGLRRIGIATGNSLTRTATPLTTLQVHDAPPWESIDRLVEEWRPTYLIVGMPGGDRTTPLKQRIQEFIVTLAQRYGLEVVPVDESLTSSAAHDRLREGRRSGYLRRRVDKAQLDRHAACLIAEQWMNELGDRG
jgi:putative Holliday junction resolvase